MFIIKFNAQHIVVSFCTGTKFRTAVEDAGGGPLPRKGQRGGTGALHDPEQNGVA